MNNNQQLAKSTPCANNNALETAVFSIELMQPPTPDEAKAVKAALDAFALELPGEQNGPPQGFFVAIGSSMPPFGEAVRFMAKPTGEHAWRVQLTANVMQVMCTDYTRYAEVWPRAKRYLQAMLAALHPAAQISNVSHQYIDKFLYPPETQEADYSARELFMAGTPYLTQQAWQSGLEWHVHQGWFDYTNAPARRMLHQLNVSNAVLSAPVSRLACVIDHRCLLQYLVTQMPTAGGLAAPNAELDDFVQELHTAHKAMLGTLLCREKLQEIGMES